MGSEGAPRHAAEKVLLVFVVLAGVAVLATGLVAARQPGWTIVVDQAAAVPTDAAAVAEEDTPGDGCLPVEESLGSSVAPAPAGSARSDTVFSIELVDPDPDPAGEVTDRIGVPPGAGGEAEVSCAS